MWKTCIKCGKHKALWAFYKLKKGTAFSVRSYCIQCVCDTRQKYYKKNKEKIRLEFKRYYRKNKESIKAWHKTYYQENKELVLTKDKEYREKNPEILKQRRKEQYQKHRDRRLAEKKAYYQENSSELRKRNRLYLRTGAKYEAYYKQLTTEESPRLARDGISLEVKCRYCRKYFIPSNSNVRHRLQALNGFANDAENNLYCSEQCKVACSVFRTRAIVPNKKSYRESTPEEVRQIVFERCDYTCEKCGEAEAVICHHWKPVAYDPMLQADPDSCMGVCKECHDEIHHQPGCTYPELRKYSHNNCELPLDKS